MANQEVETRQGFINSENGKVFEVDPAVLMQDNPAALIVNHERYASMSAYFSPDLFEPLQIVRVKVYTPEHGETIKMFVVDGMTRTKYAADHKGEAVSDFPNWNFGTIRVRDVTDSYLKNPTFALPEERQENQQALTLLQYLRAVIPPTMEHAEIAIDRIAAHLLNAWDNMVGDDLANKYSAIAALSFLQRVSIAPTILQNVLKRQPTLLAKEGLEDRGRLEKAILDMAAIIRTANLTQKDVALSAFQLVSAKSPVIGDAQKARKELYGLLHTPEVETKLERAFPEEAQREPERYRLGETIEAAFKRFSASPTILSTLDEALQDNSLDLKDIQDIFSADDPMKRNSQIKKEQNIQRLTQIYSSIRRKGEFTDTELRLIQQLGGVTYFFESQSRQAVNAIVAADVAVEEANHLLSQLDNQREKLIKQGVKSETLTEALSLIQTHREDLLGSTKTDHITKRVQNLRDKLNQIKHTIDVQIKTRKIGELVDEIYGDEVKLGFDLHQIRHNIITYIYQRTQELTSELEIRNRVTQLKTLDADLQTLVVRGEMQMHRALQNQKQREALAKTIIPPQPQETPAKPVQELPAAEVKTPPAEITESPIASSPAHVARPEDFQVMTATEIENRRKRLNNEKLRSWIRESKSFLETIDLEPDEVTTENKDGLRINIMTAGRWAYNHPDVRRIIEDYLRTLQQNIKANEVRIQKQEQEPYKKQ